MIVTEGEIRVDAFLLLMVDGFGGQRGCRRRCVEKRMPMSLMLIETEDQRKGGKEEK